MIIDTQICKGQLNDNPDQVLAAAIYLLKAKALNWELPS